MPKRGTFGDAANEEAQMRRAVFAIALALLLAAPAGAAPLAKPKMCGVYATYRCSALAKKTHHHKTCGVYARYTC
jgi:uncharacterized membrane protein